MPDETFLEILHKPSIKIQGAQETSLTSGTLEAEKADGLALDLADSVMEKTPNKEVLAVSPDWTQPLLANMINGNCPTYKTEARRIVSRSKAYKVISRELYKRSQTRIFEDAPRKKKE